MLSLGGCFGSDTSALGEDELSIDWLAMARDCQSG
jgi:hypothetical protein